MSNYVTSGADAETNLVIKLNHNKSNAIWKKLGISNTDDYFAIRVNKKVFSKKTKQRVSPKTDVYIAKGVMDSSYLSDREFFLTENDVEMLKLSKISGTGISIKRLDSINYTIHKWTPDSFYRIFCDYNLGAGASIFRLRENELEKNHDLLKGWNTTWKSFEEYFQHIENIGLLKDESQSFNIRREIASNVSKFSIQKITDLIKNVPNISDHVFMGTSDFAEPYNATWFYIDGKIEKASVCDFQVTTGSGRSKGTYTLVIKPKK
ncbi:MAG: hypothetical protein O3C48_08130 [Crenarchaeota archaeon]|nr:hypothetical protein [Thermoproteota archaeon]